MKKKETLVGLLKRHENCAGPFVIVARPHSGTRLLAEAFLKNGIFMGSYISQGFLDSYDWYRKFVFPLVISEYFPNWDEYRSSSAFRKFCDERITDSFSSSKLVCSTSKVITRCS